MCNNGSSERDLQCLQYLSILENSAAFCNPIAWKLTELVALEK